MKTWNLPARRVLGITLVLATVLPAAALAQLETVILFDPALVETPESLRFDRHDNLYITLGLTGEIRKIDRHGNPSTLAFLPIGAAQCAGLFPPPAALGLTFDFADQLYAGIFACDPTQNGIWRIDTDSGELEHIAVAPSFSALNGLDVRFGWVYAADTFGGLVWRAPKNGGELEVWADSPLLEPVPGAPGPNGLRIFRNTVYVAHSGTGNIIAIPILPGGAAGEPRVHATLPFGGCDDFAIDILGSIYCTTDPFNTVVRLDPDGTSEILLTAADGLDGPTSATFGRRWGNRRNLYITNAAFPFFPGPDPRRPSLLRLRLDVPGAPLVF